MRTSLPNVPAAAAHRFLRFAALLCAALLFSAPQAHALTRAGTVITNQSSAQFEWFGVQYNINSNIVYNTVSPVHGVSIRPDGTVEDPALTGYGVPLQTVLYSYILTNTGNVTDSYDLLLPFLPERSTREPLDRRIYLDGNGNGRLEPGEAANTISKIERLPAGDFVYLLVAIEVPLRARVNDTFYFDLQATSHGDPTQRDVGNVNRTIVPADAIVRLEKSVSPNRVIPGQLIRYELNLQNRGVATARGVDVVVDGMLRTGILVHDEVPYNENGRLEYLPDSVIGAPARGMRLYSTNNRLTWTSARSQEEEPPAEDVTDIAFLFDLELQPNQQAQLVFQARVPDFMPPGRIENRAEVWYRTQAGTVESDTATNAVLVDVLPTVYSVYIGPERDPRAQGDTDTNDDLTLDRGVNPETNDNYRVAGGFVYFTNTVENAATGRDTINITMDPTIAAEAAAEAMARASSSDMRAASGSTLPVTTLPKRWLVQFFGGDGATPLRDTNGDGIVDVGPLDPGQAADVVVRIYIPPDTVTDDNGGNGFQAVIRATSSIDPGKFNLTVDRIPKVESLTTFWDNFRKDQFAPEIVEEGTEITYRNTFGHSGNFLVFNAIIIDELSPYLTPPSALTSGVIRNLLGDGFVSVTGSYDAATHRIIWMIPVIPPNFLGEIEFTCNVAEGTPPGQEIENTFSIQSQLTPAVRVSNLVRVVSGASAILGLRKDANREEAQIGDPVAYTIQASNQSPSHSLADVVLYDDLARGFRYRVGTAVVNGVRTEPEVSEDGKRLTWHLGPLDPGERHEIGYVTIVTPEAPAGTGVNTATLEARFPLGSLARLRATADVKIIESVFSPVSTIIGRVYIDANDNRVVDPGEPGIEGVRIYMDDGTYVLTDRDGLYSIPGVRGKTRTLRLDQSTLADKYQLLEVDDRNAGDPASVLVDVRMGMLRKANFRVRTLDDSLLGDSSTEQLRMKLEPIRVETTPTAARVTIEWSGTGRAQLFTEGQSGLVLANIPGAADTSALRDAIFTHPLLQSVRTYVDQTTQQTRVQVRLQKRVEGYSADQVRTISDEGSVVIEIGDKNGWEGQEPTLEVLTQERAKADGDDVSSAPVILSPLEGTAYMARDKINVRTRAAMTATVRLLVNGVEVPETQIGEKALNIPERRTYYDYVSVPLKPGRNTLTFEANHRGKVETSEITVVLADRPKSIELAVAPMPLYADGVTEPLVAITLLDASGVPTGEATVITIEIDKGSVKSPDFRPLEPGYQAQIRDGRALVRLSHAAQPETRKLRVTLGDVTKEAEVFFAPHLRDWIIVGTVEATGGITDSKVSRREDPDGQDGWHSTGDHGTSVFVKGTLPWHDIVVTGNYDSTRDREHTRLFRQFQPDDYYPVYGDESELGYEAPSRDEFYLKLERGESYVMYGDFDTDLNETQLAGNSRRFTGAKADIKTDYLDVKGFAAYTDQAEVRIEFPGQGVSGYYQLPHRNIIRGSEEIVLETRDRDRPTEVVRSETLGRFSDYNFDYRIGRILFKRPIRAYDFDFNPIVVVVRYELEDDTQREYWTYGGRAAVHDMDRRVTVGASQIVTQKALQDDVVQGTDLTVQITRDLVARAEYAESDTGEFGRDKAYLAEIENSGERHVYKAYYRNIGSSFENPGMRGSTTGREEYGIEGEWDLDGPWGLATNSYVRSEAERDIEERVLIVDATYDMGRTILLAGSGYVSSTSGFETDEGPIARIGMKTALTDRWELELLHQHTFADVVGEQPTRSTATVRYQLTDNTATTLTVERRRSRAGGYDTNLELGAETLYSDRLTFYNRYGVDGGANGWAGRTTHGFEANHPVNEELKLLYGAEIVKRAHGVAAASRQQNFWALTGGAEYAPLDRQMLLAWRNEFRHDDRRDQYFTELGGTTKVNVNHTLFARNRVTYSYDSEQKENEWIVDFLTGWAYRPLADDVLNIISDFEIRYEDGNGGIVSNKVHEFIVSSEAVWQPVESWTFSGKYAARYAISDYTDPLFSDLKAVSVRHYFWRRFYGQAGARWLQQYETKTHQLSYGIEAGVSPVKNLQVGLGYNFEGFHDRSFSRGDFWDRGVYVRVRFKFDESVLGWLQWMEERREGVSN